MDAQTSPLTVSVSVWFVTFQTTIVDGSTGEPVLQPYIKDAVGAQTSPLTVSVEGYGNDIFLYLTSDCLGFEGQEGSFSFVKGLMIIFISRQQKLNRNISV